MTEKYTFTSLMEQIGAVLEDLLSNFPESKLPDNYKFFLFSENCRTMANLLQSFYVQLISVNYNINKNAREEINDFFINVRDELWIKVIENYEFIYDVINCINVDDKVIISDLIFVIITRCNMCILIEIDNNSPYEMNYILMNSLVKTKTKVLNMNVFEIVDSIKQLSYKWNNLIYDDELQQYIFLLEMRCSMLMNSLQTSIVHNVKEFRIEIKVGDNKEKNNTNKYKCSRQLINLFASHIINFKIRLSNHFILDYEECPDEYLDKLEFKMNKLKAWLQKMAKKTFGDEIYVKFRINYLPRIERPGEKEEYMRKRPNDVVTPQKVYRQIRGDACAQKLLEFSSNREASIILEDSEKEHSESMPTMAEIILNRMFKGLFDLDMGRYVIFRDEIKYRHMEITMETDPIIIQTFNHFNVAYNGVIYKTYGFIKSFIIWLNIIELDFNRRLENGTLDFSAIYAQIYGHNYLVINKLPTNNESYESDALCKSTTNNTNKRKATSTIDTKNKRRKTTRSKFKKLYSNSEDTMFDFYENEQRGIMR